MAKADPGRIEVDKELALLEKKIEKEYRQATKDLKEKLNKYLSAFEKEDKQKQELVKAGKITEEQYKKWRIQKLTLSKQWTEMKNTLAKDLTNVDKIAVDMISDSLPNAYAISHNYGTYEIEKGSRVNTSYTLYDRNTVKKLIKEQPDLLPKPGIDKIKDGRWNREHIQSAITQGILQGESISRIASRLKDVSDMDMRAAITNARTMTTAAENAGRIDSYQRAEDMGIKMVQVWVATLDSRTRDAHRELDGQERPVGKPFHNSLGDIMYPGDPHADPGNVYNCRCTLIAKVEGSKLDERIKQRQDSTIGGLSYDEWKKSKEVKWKAK